MQQLAESAGITKATLYHHFVDKADLFEAMMRDRFGRSQADLAGSVDAGWTIHDKLVAFATVLYSAERVDLSRLLGDFHLHVDKARQRAFWERFERPWTYLEGALGEAMAAGEIAPGDPKLIAQVCFSAFVGQVQIGKFEADIPSPTRETAEAIVEMLLSGLAPR
jgi:AcrR family transcriptional regulator